MGSERSYEALIALLLSPELVVARWTQEVASSSMRPQRQLDKEGLAARLQLVAEGFATVARSGGEGPIPSSLRFVPGHHSLREIEQAVSFTAATLAAAGFSAFYVGAIFFGLRDVLCPTLSGDAREELQLYMEWLVVLAADSLATARERAAEERWSNQLDDGTPLLMITEELPAALFVCKPDRRVIASVFARLLFSVVRAGGAAAIIDVRGMAGRLDPTFAEGLERFVAHEHIAKRLRVLACGVHLDDVPAWREIGARHEVDMHFDNYFEGCVATALETGGWRLIAPG